MSDMAGKGSSSESAFTAPVSGVFALNKPSGPTSMSLLERLKPLFASSTLFSSPNAPAKLRGKQAAWQRKQLGKSALPNATVKIGQGGTLDPVASGVMVIGLNEGTKKLGAYQSQCDKTYEALAMLGCETDSYDSKGKRIALRGWKGIEEADVEAACTEIARLETQVPPM